MQLANISANLGFMGVPYRPEICKAVLNNRFATRQIGLGAVEMYEIVKLASAGFFAFKRRDSHGHQ